MFSVKNWLTSVLLVAAISSPSFASASKDPNFSPAPIVVKQEISVKVDEPKKDFHYYLNIYDGEISKEISRRHDRLKDLEE